jgi:streptogramin lyase
MTNSIIRSWIRSLCWAVVLASVTHGASGGTVSGVVKDSAGSPFQGAFVRARKGRMTTTVLSGRDGRYRLENLVPGDYRIQATATGYKSEEPKDSRVAAARTASLDFSLQKDTVRWSDLSIYQASKLLPDARGKDVLFGRCFACHGFQTRMAATSRTEAGWHVAVKYMQVMEHYFLSPTFTDQNASDVTSYLIAAFGVDSKLPRSPAELPGYREVAPAFSEEATKIVFVDYDLPGPSRFPWSGYPDNKGHIWMPYYGRADRIARLDPNSGEVQEFKVPFTGTAGIHSAFPAPDGAVWFSEQGSNRLGKWDPSTQAITEYQHAYIPGKEGTSAGGSKHTVRVDAMGTVWATGAPLSRLDPATGKFTDYPEVPTAYGIEIDPQGNVWFTEFTENGKLGKVDAKTGQVTKYALPTPKAYPRRIALDPQGFVWVAEYRGGKIARFDVKTETFQEFSLPGGSPTPYGIAIDRHKFIWYSSMDMDTIGRLDPATGAVLEFPFLYPENGIREFLPDSAGKIWFATGPNNKVGYFIPYDGTASVAENQPRR